MERQPTHLEWARFKLIGRPLLTGMATGPTNPFWVACRASPCLVHVYKDAELQALLRFPQDPVFMLFGEPQGSAFQHNSIPNKKVSRESGHNPAALIVITSDGHIWSLAVIDGGISIERPSKRYKESSISMEPEKFRFRKDSLDSAQLCTETIQDEWDLFEDVDVYQAPDWFESSMLLRSVDNACDRKMISNEVSKQGPKGNSVPYHKTLKDRLSTLCLQLTYAPVCSPQKSFKKIQAISVEQDALCVVPGACLAACGPNSLVSIVSPFGGPEFFHFQGSSSATSPFYLQVSSRFANYQSGNARQPTCVLFVTALENCTQTRYYWCGAFISRSLFDALSIGLSAVGVDHLLLQGIQVYSQSFICKVYCKDSSGIRAVCNVVVTLPWGHSQGREPSLMLNGSTSWIFNRRWLEKVLGMTGMP